MFGRLKLYTHALMFCLGLPIGFWLANGFEAVSKHAEVMDNMQIRGTRFSVVDQGFLGKEHLSLVMDDSTKMFYLYSSGGCMTPYTNPKRR